MYVLFYVCVLLYCVDYVLLYCVVYVLLYCVVLLYSVALSFLSVLVYDYCHRVQTQLQ
jgi:hypothetical protein